MEPDDRVDDREAEMPLRMAPAPRAAYAQERSLAASAADTTSAWHHLERAHVLAQPFVIAHVGSHVAMLRRAVVERDGTEVVGQVVRIVLAGPASAVGKIPTGNPGRARVPLAAERAVPADLAAILTDDDAR
jgi:hypothetical protein